MSKQIKKAVMYIVPGIIFILAVVVGKGGLSTPMLLFAAIVYLALGITYLIRGIRESRNKE